MDSLTLWLAQWSCDDCNLSQNSTWEGERKALVDSLPSLPGEIIPVSNEVGLRIVPLGEINRKFQDEQGRLNQDMVKVCEKVVLMAAGVALALKG